MENKKELLSNIEKKVAEALRARAYRGCDYDLSGESYSFVKFGGEHGSAGSDWTIDNVVDVVMHEVEFAIMHS